MNILSGTNTLNVTMVYTAGYGTLTGKVTDSVSGAVLSGVTVAFNGTVLATTDSSGNYTTPTVEAGTYTVTFTLAGYTTVTK
jgi:hypothetical protein